MQEKPPMFSRLVVPYLPNNPPRWLKSVETIKKIVEVYAIMPGNMKRMESGSKGSVGRPSSAGRASPSPNSHIDDFTYAREDIQDNNPVQCSEVTRR